MKHIIFIFILLLNFSYLNAIDNEYKILMKGWLKFFTYENSTIQVNKPSKFEINAAFSQNESISAKKDNSDEYGSFVIPSPNHFFFVLTKSSLYVITGRKNDVARTVKSLEIKWIIPTRVDPSTRAYSGGIEDLGNFKEGFCFRLKARNFVVWNLCADSNGEKEKWQDAIGLLVTSEENYLSENLTRQSIILPPELGNFTNFHFDANDPNSNNTKEILNNKNGRWVIIQDWSQCTLSCGGGKQYLQRICVPPKQGGASCDGPNILEKDCNSFECPNYIEEGKIETLPPVIKMQRFFNRPQRYEVCVIKEGDLELLLETGTKGIEPRIPIRAVLNNRTISFFTSSDYSSIYKSFDLSNLLLKSPPSSPQSCFTLLDSIILSKRIVLCIPSYTLTKNQQIKKIRDEWINDIFIFKTKCKEKTIERDENADNERKGRLKKYNQQDPEERKKRLEEMMEEREELKEMNIERKVESTARYALEVMEKELKMEQLAIREELMREREAEKLMDNEVEEERNKERLIEKQLVLNEKLKKMNNHRTELELKIESIKKQALDQISQARLKTKERIEIMKKMTDRRKKDTKREILEIRSKIARKLLSEARKGNMSFCEPNRTEAERNQYCSENFKEDYDRLNDCKNNSADFCYTCCENEFGRIYEDLRDKCYQRCDEFSDAHLITEKK